MSSLAETADETRWVKHPVEFVFVSFYLSFIGTQLQQPRLQQSICIVLLGFNLQWGHSSDFHLTVLHEFWLNH